MSAHPAQSIAMSPAPADIAVFSKSRRLVLTVDVRKSRLYATEESAASLRRTLMKHELLPDLPFFMLGTLDQIYLWCGDADPGALPHYSASAKPILDYYGSPHHERSVYGGALEIVLFFWLSGLADGRFVLPPDSQADRILIESGLYGQIQGGSADFDVTL